MPVLVPFLPFIVAAAGAGFSASQSIKAASKQKKAAKEQKRAAEHAREAERIQQVRADLASRKARVQQIREARIRRAEILQRGINSGAGLGTSTTSAAMGSIVSTFGGNVGDISQQQGLSRSITNQNLAGAEASSRANTFQGQAQVAETIGGLGSTIGNLGSSIFNREGGFTTIFGGNTHKGAS